MRTIQIRHNPVNCSLEMAGVFSAFAREKESQGFLWKYDKQTTCYLLEGDIVVTPNGGQPVQVGNGDLGTFPAGMSCDCPIHMAV